MWPFSSDVHQFTHLWKVQNLAHHHLLKPPDIDVNGFTLLGNETLVPLPGAKGYIVRLNGRWGAVTKHQYLTSCPRMAWWSNTAKLYRQISLCERHHLVLYSLHGSFLFGHRLLLCRSHMGSLNLLYSRFGVQLDGFVECQKVTERKLLNTQGIFDLCRTFQSKSFIGVHEKVSCKVCTPLNVQYVLHSTIFLFSSHAFEWQDLP